MLARDVETGALEVTVLGPDGGPVEGAAVWVHPSDFIRGVGSAIVPGRTWSQGTDANGVARFVDLPPNDSLGWDATANDLQMTEMDRKRSPRAKVESGKTATDSIQLETAGGD